MFKYFKKLRKEQEITLILVISAIFVAFLAHSWGMFRYPYYENDEGIYISQAYSLLTSGKLSPYTYWYDHAPLGWITIAVWAKFTGGLFTFGASANSGRVLMLVVHLASTILIFFCAKKFSKSNWTAMTATLIFSLSPLAIYYQRRVLLDNMMIFWILLSLAILLKKKIGLKHLIMSAVFFAFGVLTKESAVVFFPALIYTLFLRRKEFSQKFVELRWMVTAGLIGTLYPFYAFLHGELFPKGFRGDTTDHLSLIDTLLWQAKRGSGLSFWNAHSEFFLSLQDWLFRDPYLTVFGIISSLVVITLGFQHKKFRILALLLLFPWLFLLRGKLVFNFYIIPLIPFFAIAIAMLVEIIASYVAKGRKDKVFIGVYCAFSVIVITSSFFYSNDVFVKNETAPQIEAVRWVKQNLPADSHIAIDDYAYVDYHDSHFENEKVFNNADVFWKIEVDPQVQKEEYKNDWTNIDYIVTGEAFNLHLRNGELSFIKNAFLSSSVLKEWKSEDSEFAYKASVHKVDHNMPLVIEFGESEAVSQQLNQSWKVYKKFFLRSYGQIVDPSNGITTSEAQSYAMLRAVWADDKDSFDGVWQWTVDHLQFRKGDKLISWKWELDKLQDSTNASDADEDIALALLFAYKKWGDESYLESAKEIIEDLGEHCVVEIAGINYFLSAHWESVEQWNGFLLNPSYLSPASYRIFAQVDKNHDWEKTANDSYAVLEAIRTKQGNKTGLPFDWALADKETGVISSANEYFDYDVDRFSFDAFRTFWRVALDYAWFQSFQSEKYIKRENQFLEMQYNQQGTLPGGFAPGGEVVLPNSTLAIDAGYLSALMLSRDKSLIEKFYQEKFVDKYDEDTKYWGNDKYSYYDSNWAWFAVALKNGNLKNIWETSKDKGE